MHQHITIKDFPCGSGKTTSMIKEFNKESKYLVILPLLSEVDRVIKETRDVVFVQPSVDDNRLGLKSESLKELLLTGQNIATTHKMYEQLVPMVELGLLDDYNIIIDEVPDVVKAVSSLSKTSIRELYINTGFICIDESTGCVIPTEKWESNRKEVADTLKANILTYAETGCLYLLEGQLFLWAMPSKLLLAGKSLTILTFKASGSILLSYLNKLNIYPNIIKNEINEEKFRKKAKELITIKEISSISKLSLTYTSQIEGLNKNSYYSKISNALKNLRCRELKSIPLENILITCLKAGWFKNNNSKNKLSGNFSRKSKIFNANWVSNTTRGTNNYSHCSHLIYLYDQHINPLVGRWINDCSKQFNDRYALTELIQWVWRSRIRKGEPITLYLPSSRMRDIFMDWIEDKKCKRYMNF